MDLSTLNLHPPIASFPAPLLLLAASLECAQLFMRKSWLNPASSLCLVLAGIFACFAFFTGYSASEGADQTFAVPAQAIALHHTVGRLLLFVLVPCIALHFIARNALHGVVVFRVLYMVLLSVCVALVVYTCYLGGKLVFEHGAGVRAHVQVS